MRLIVIGTGSNGNCYLLRDNNGSVLIIECGLTISKIKQGLDFNLNDIAGCLLSHSHSDHSKSAQQLTQLGIKIYTTPLTKQSLGFDSRNIIAIPPLRTLKLGAYTIKPFDCKHDVEIYGFLIEHEEMGTTLFMTDTYYCEYIFPGLNNIIIEANYCENIVEEKMQNSQTNGFLRDRVIESHMSLQTCIKTLQEYDLSKVNNIVVIHLSDSHSDENLFLHEIRNATGKNVTIADKGKIINFDLTPF